jgi:hypothetical protein
MPRLTLLLALCLGCHLPGLESFTSYEPDDTSSTGSATTDVTPTTGQILTTTAPPEPGTSSGDPGEESSTGEPPPPVLPPSIVDHSLSPDPLKKPGTIEAMIIAENASSVQMQVDDGDAIDLAGGPDIYTGGIPIYTGLSSGTHWATFVASRDGLDSEPLIVPFEVGLPAPGEGYVWESADLIGTGTVAAIVALPPGDDAAAMIEWGTYYPGGKPRCYLRQRDALGGWGPADFVEVLPGTECVAIDLAAGPEGELYLLASRKTGNDVRWWLGKAATWATAATPENVTTGSLGDVAEAVAVGAGKVAVCGTRPVANPVDKIDAAVWVVGEAVRLFDYDTPEFDEHRFDETLRDCIINEGILVGVGDVFGRHTPDPNEPKRRRHLRLRVDLASSEATLHVGAELGAATQSVANGVAIDNQGRTVTVGHLCGDTCEPDAELWVHGPNDTLEWYASLGPDIASPFAIAASPAGYLVLASARKKDAWWSAFWMRAYFIGQYQPVWTFEHDDAQQPQFATAVAVSSAGHVYGGGVGANGYPAVVYVTP